MACFGSGIKHNFIDYRCHRCGALRKWRTRAGRLGLPSFVWRNQNIFMRGDRVDDNIQKIKPIATIRASKYAFSATALLCSVSRAANTKHTGPSVITAMSSNTLSALASSSASYPLPVNCICLSGRTTLDQCLIRKNCSLFNKWDCIFDQQCTSQDHPVLTHSPRPVLPLGEQPVQLCAMTHPLGRSRAGRLLLYLDLSL